MNCVPFLLVKYHPQKGKLMLCLESRWWDISALMDSNNVRAGTYKIILILMILFWFWFFFFPPRSWFHMKIEQVRWCTIKWTYRSLVPWFHRFVGNNCKIILLMSNLCNLDCLQWSEQHVKGISSGMCVLNYDRCYFKYSYKFTELWKHV